MAFQVSEHRAAAPTERRARKMRLRNRAPEHISENGSNGHIPDASTVLRDYTSSHHDELNYPSTQGHFGYYLSTHEQLQSQVLYDRARTVHESQWRSTLEAIPGIRWEGNDPWYLAIKRRKGKEYRQWDRVPILRPEERSRYETYKNRKRKDLNSTKEYVVWPPHLEQAFEIAWLSVPPILGKKKVPLTQPDGKIKQSGRNELIAWIIYQLTGERRSRKQISSHMQVVGKFRKHDGELLLQSMKATPEEIAAADCKAVRFDEGLMKLVIGEPMLASLPSLPIRGNTMLHQAPTSRLDPLAQRYGSEIIVRNVEFDMSLQSTEKRTLLHNCTTMQSDRGCHPRLLNGDDLEMFPDLQKRLAVLEDHACDLVVFDATINLVDEWPSVHSQLEIFYVIEFSCHDSVNEWRFRTTRYENRGKYKDQIISPKTSRQALRAERLGDGRCRLSDAPLISDWWVKILGTALDRHTEARGKAEKLMNSLDHGTCGCESCSLTHQESRAMIATAEDYSRRKIQDMSFMQEVFLGQDEKPVNIFLWKFRQAHEKETATTTWRRIIRDDIKPPSPPLPKPSMILSSNIVPKQNTEVAPTPNPTNGHCSPSLFHELDVGWQTQVFDPEILRQQMLNAEDNWIANAATSIPQSEVGADHLSWMSSCDNLVDQQSSISSTGSASLSQILTPTESDLPVSFSDTAFSSQATAASFDFDFGGFAPYSHLPSTQGSIVPSRDSQLDFGDVVPEELPYGRLLGDFRSSCNQLALDKTQRLGDSAFDDNDLRGNLPPPSRSRPQTADGYAHQRPTPTLHALQSRRLVASTNLLSPHLPDCCQHAVHDSVSTYSSFDIITGPGVHDAPIAQSLCADGSVLASLHNQDFHNTEPSFPFESLYDHHDNPYFVSTVPATHILPSNDETSVLPSHWHSSSSDLQQGSTNELQSSLLASANPQAANHPSSALGEEQHSSQPAAQDALAFADHVGSKFLENEQQHPAGFPENDNSWVCDIAIAQLEGWIEHANAMEAQLAGFAQGGESSSVHEEVGQDTITAGGEGERVYVPGGEERLGQGEWIRGADVGVDRDIKVEEAEGDGKGEGHVTVEMEDVGDVGDVVDADGGVTTGGLKVEDEGDLCE